MSTTAARPSRTAGRRLGALVAILILGASLGGALAGCGGSGSMSTSSPAASSTAGLASAAAEASVPMGGMTMPTQAEVSAAWDARPDYVRELPEAGQAAYRFALERPDVLQWLPCYCGCTGIPHRSNLDCYFVRREVKGTFAYEQHASFCDICVKTANMASDMLRQGASMTQIRAAVDSTFGGGAVPGTDTPTPPPAAS